MACCNEREQQLNREEQHVTATARMHQLMHSSSSRARRKQQQFHGGNNWKEQKHLYAKMRKHAKRRTVNSSRYGGGGSLEIATPRGKPKINEDILGQTVEEKATFGRLRYPRPDSGRNSRGFTVYPLEHSELLLNPARVDGYVPNTPRYNTSTTKHLPTKSATISCSAVRRHGRYGV